MDATEDLSGAGDDDPVAALIAERDLWRQRASESEDRWEAFLALENERAELRRQASETLERDRLTLIAERDEWKRRATDAESRLTELSSVQPAPVDERERAIPPEPSSEPVVDEPSPAEDEREQPSQRHRFRGSWFRENNT